MSELTIGRFRGGYCVQWTDPETGKRRRYRLAARTVEGARAEAITVYHQHNRPAGATIADLWASYLTEREGRRIARDMGYAAKNVLGYFGEMLPPEITTGHCREYSARRRAAGLGDGSIWTELGYLRTVLNWAAKHRLIDYAPPVERPPKPAPRDRWLTHQEIGKLLDAADAPHIRLAMLLMLSTGGRVSAILELTWDRVDLERGQIDLRTDPNGPRKGRAVVPINPGLRAALEVAAQAAMSDYVVEWAGGPVKSIRKGISEAARRAGVEGVSPHVFRHTAAVHMAAAGVPMPQISQYLGHSHVSITERVYARFAPDHLRDAAAVVDFARVRSVQ